jgi:hypothetical protein
VTHPGEPTDGIDVRIQQAPVCHLNQLPKAQPESTAHLRHHPERATIGAAAQLGSEQPSRVPLPHARRHQCVEGVIRPTPEGRWRQILRVMLACRPERALSQALRHRSWILTFWITSAHELWIKKSQASCHVLAGMAAHPIKYCER